MGGNVESKEAELAMLWVLNLSDGVHSLLEIAERSKLAFPAVRAAAWALETAGLLRATDRPAGASP
jgi:aminopeptidase-like protein